MKMKPKCTSNRNSPRRKRCLRTVAPILMCLPKKSDAEDETKIHVRTDYISRPTHSLQNPANVEKLRCTACTLPRVSIVGVPSTRRYSGTKPGGFGHTRVHTRVFFPSQTTYVPHQFSVILGYITCDPQRYTLPIFRSYSVMVSPIVYTLLMF